MITQPKKLCITYICTGKYNTFFNDFYESFKENFCQGNYLSFAVFTDKPSLYIKYKDCHVYHVQRYHRNSDIDFVKFRKWRDILLAEDYLMTQDYCFYINGNLRCVRPVTLDELFNGKDQYAVHHSLFDIDKKPMYDALCKCDRSACYFNAQDRSSYPNYMYFQAGNVGATSKKFLKMCQFIESARLFDNFYGYTQYVPWHDETYYNKYINSLIKTSKDTINILDGKLYLCSWLNEMKPYLSRCKMLLTNKDTAWKKGT